MKEKILKYKSQNHELTLHLSDDEDNYTGNLVDFCGIEALEVNINLDYYIGEESFPKIPEFIDYLNENLTGHLQVAIEKLPVFVSISGYFPDNFEDFTFDKDAVLWINYIDNTFSVGKQWEYEIVFCEYKLDCYGQWIITFHGPCIKGIRRETL